MSSLPFFHCVKSHINYIITKWWIFLLVKHKHIHRHNEANKTRKWNELIKLLCYCLIHNKCWGFNTQHFFFLSLFIRLAAIFSINFFILLIQERGKKKCLWLMKLPQIRTNVRILIKKISWKSFFLLPFLHFLRAVLHVHWLFILSCWCRVDWPEFLIIFKTWREFEAWYFLNSANYSVWW